MPRHIHAGAFEIDSFATCVEGTRHRKRAILRARRPNVLPLSFFFRYVRFSGLCRKRLTCIWRSATPVVWSQLCADRFRGNCRGWASIARIDASMLRSLRVFLSELCFAQLSGLRNKTQSDAVITRSGHMPLRLSSARGGQCVGSLSARVEGRPDCFDAGAGFIGGARPDFARESLGARR